jgi:hypothetical protein
MLSVLGVLSVLGALFGSIVWEHWFCSVVWVRWFCSVVWARWFCFVVWVRCLLFDCLVGALVVVDVFCWVDLKMPD